MLSLTRLMYQIFSGVCLILLIGGSQTLWAEYKGQPQSMPTRPQLQFAQPREQVFSAIAAPVPVLKTAAAARRASQGAGETGGPNPSAYKVVPLKSSKNALMVEATLTNPATGQQSTGTFIIDTGATYTSISRDMAEELGLDMTNTANSVHITTANGRINVPKVVIGQLEVNGVKAKNIQATVIEIHPDSAFSGLLGLSFIRQFKMTIDPAANQLVFEPN